MPPRSEASASSVGLITAAAADAVRSVTVFVDNQTTMPLVLTEKTIGPKDGRWTWSDRLVPARVRENEKIVMASESTGSYIRATRAAATVVYRLESEKAERFKGLLRLEVSEGPRAANERPKRTNERATWVFESHKKEVSFTYPSEQKARDNVKRCAGLLAGQGNACTANAALHAAVAVADADADAIVGVLLDAIAEAASSARVVVRREQVQVRCRHGESGGGEGDDDTAAAAAMTTGWLSFTPEGQMIWRPALPEEQIVAVAAPAAEPPVAEDFEATIPSEEPQAEGEPEAKAEPEPEPEPETEQKWVDGPEPAEPEDWEPKTLDELGGGQQLELLSDSGEDGVMSLAFLVSGGAVASILRSPSPVASPKDPAAAASPKSSDGDSPPDASDVLAPELAVRPVEPASCVTLSSYF